MELGELKVFVTVATERSFSRTAITLSNPAGGRSAVDDFVEALRCAGEDRASRPAPIAMRAAR
jgi:hypothetical protein